MTAPSVTSTEAPDLIGVGAQSIVDRSKSLGLVWTRRLATVNDGSNPANCTITFDNDTEIVTAVSMVGALPANTRVYVDMVPPSANFITGLVTTHGNPFTLGIASVNAASPGGTTTSATYVNLPGPPTVTITKGLASTRLRIDMHATMLSTLANTSVRIAANVASADTDIAQLVINPASTHLQVSGTAIVTAAVSGSVTVTGRWRRVAGGGTPTMGTDDWVSMTVAEIL